MHRLWVVCVSLTAVAGGLVVVQAVPAFAANPIQFARIQYDSPGKDTGSNASLNGELFQLKNSGHGTINLKNWTVRDAQNHVYKFASSFNPVVERRAGLQELLARAAPAGRGVPADDSLWLR